MKLSSSANKCGRLDGNVFALFFLSILLWASDLISHRRSIEIVSNNDHPRRGVFSPLKPTTFHDFPSPSKLLPRSARLARSSHLLRTANNVDFYREISQSWAAESRSPSEGERNSPLVLKETKKWKIDWEKKKLKKTWGLAALLSWACYWKSLKVLRVLHALISASNSHLRSSLCCLRFLFLVLWVVKVLHSRARTAQAQALSAGPTSHAIGHKSTAHKKTTTTNLMVKWLRRASDEASTIIKTTKKRSSSPVEEIKK